MKPRFHPHTLALSLLPPISDQLPSAVDFTFTCLPYAHFLPPILPPSECSPHHHKPGLLQQPSSWSPCLKSLPDPVCPPLICQGSLDTGLIAITHIPLPSYSTNTNGSLFPPRSNTISCLALKVLHNLPHPHFSTFSVFLPAPPAEHPF